MSGDKSIKNANETISKKLKGLIVKGTGLATLVKVNYTDKIKNRDKKELINMAGGRYAVVEKGKYKSNDVVVFVKTNSIFPENSKYFKLTNGKPIREIKFDKISFEGIVISLDDICKDFNIEKNTLKLGDDVTDLIGVMKYVEEEEKSVYDGNDFPTEIVPKTEEEYGKNLIIYNENKYDKEKDNPKTFWLNEQTKVVITKKVDGASFTVLITKNLKEEWNVLFFGRNKKINFNDKFNKHFEEVVKKYLDSNVLIKYCQEKNYQLGIQGEVFGPGINANRCGVDEISFKVFNIYDINSKKYIDFKIMKEICDDLKLDVVEIVYYGNFKDEFTMEYLLELTENQFYENGKVCEGIVFKTEGEQRRLSFKLLSKKFKEINNSNKK